MSSSAGLKQACPEGVFISLTPDDPALWAGVLFVRDGVNDRLIDQGFLTNVGEQDHTRRRS
jgi:hypothetical protein